MLDVIDCVPSQVLSKIVSSSVAQCPDAGWDCPCPCAQSPQTGDQESPSSRSAHYQAHVTQHNGRSHRQSALAW